MKAIIRRELKNYLKNPFFWIGLIFIVFQMYQILNPYLHIHYYQQGEAVEELSEENIGDADITDGYVPTGEDKRMELACERVKRDMVQALAMTEEEADEILAEMRRADMSLEEMEIRLAEDYNFYAKYGISYYYDVSEFHKGSAGEINGYLDKSLSEHTYSYYMGRKFTDFCGLFLGFTAMLLLAFLFIRDTKRDTWELLHTKPVSASAYICGKAMGGFLAMALLWGFLTLLFGGLCEYAGIRNGFPVSLPAFFATAAVYILPNLLMIVSVYTATALVFKNPLPAVPVLFLYMIYSNMGSRGPDGSYGYFGRPLAIMVRFPGKFFETVPPPLAVLNQTYLVLASVLLLVISIGIWKRRRVY